MGLISSIVFGYIEITYICFVTKLLGVGVRLLNFYDCLQARLGCNHLIWTMVGRLK